MIFSNRIREVKYWLQVILLIYLLIFIFYTCPGEHFTPYVDGINKLIFRRFLGLYS